MALNGEIAADDACEIAGPITGPLWHAVRMESFIVIRKELLD